MVNVFDSRNVNGIMRSRGTNIVSDKEVVRGMHPDLLLLKVIQNMIMLLHSAMKICQKQL